MISLAGLPLHELEKQLSPLPKYRAKQIYQWINRGVFEFGKMTDIPVNLQEELNTKYVILSSIVNTVHDDKDAKKIVFTLIDGFKIEAVLLNDGKGRYTACLSTQVGCPAGCVFCKTGSLGFKRNLDSGEIIEQLLHLNNNIEPQGTRQSLGSQVQLSSSTVNNIVIMGMGEPLLNLENLRKSISFFTDAEGMNLSRRRITVSTCGICEGLFELAQNGPYIRLALSLTTADETLRQKLMPITRANPLKKVKEALLLFQQKSSSRITLEIPLLSGINTRKKDADLIKEFSNGLDCVINIIPWNHVAGLESDGVALLEPGKEELFTFIKALENNGLKITKRRFKGGNIAGACGQLG